ncbi:hypothetical protein DRE_06490 [Drechslerella stenobrocha 248]|uniref:Uncharacterized protein n=1 Tax=Drechslerella stenobrocha 248 TaxID=1043628 RepID=W7HX71_9PEZI|nr:hypothetical protein DRE_06490 [Drechslerella stenobrocha 248]
MGPFNRPILNRKKPRGFVYQVYLALKPNLSGYRGKPTYYRVDSIILRNDGNNRRINDLLRSRRKVDIIRVALKLMQECVFKDESIAFELYPQLDPHNDDYDDFDENCSDEEYMVPASKVEPKRKPHELEIVHEHVRPPRGSKIGQQYIRPLSLGDDHPLVSVGPEEDFALASADNSKHRLSMAENQPPLTSFQELSISGNSSQLFEEYDEFDDFDYRVLPASTQAAIINRLAWIMQMTCFEFLGLHRESRLRGEQINFADSATLRYYAILIHDSANELPKDSMTADILVGQDRQKVLDHLLFPLLQLQAEMGIINQITQYTMKKYFDLMLNICETLKSRRGKKIVVLAEVTQMIFGRREEDYKEAREKAETEIEEVVEPLRWAARHEKNIKRRTVTIHAATEKENAIWTELDRQNKVIEEKYCFDDHIAMYAFCDMEDGSSLSTRKAANVITIGDDEELWDSAADSN